MRNTPPKKSRPPRKQSVRELLPVFLKAIGSPRDPDPETRRLYHDVIIASGQRPGTLRWRAAVHVISNAPGNLPTDTFEEDVQRFIDRRIERRTSALAAADASADTARQVVDETWQRTGAGPTWAELARACGVPASSAEWFVSRLHANGVVTSTTEPRSLRVIRRDE